MIKLTGLFLQTIMIGGVLTWVSPVEAQSFNGVARKTGISVRWTERYPNYNNYENYNRRDYSYDNRYRARDNNVCCECDRQPRSYNRPGRGQVYRPSPYSGGRNLYGY